MCTGKGSFVFLVIGVLWVCVWGGDQTALSWLGCTTYPGKLEETCHVWSFQVLNFLPQQRL